MLTFDLDHLDPFIEFLPDLQYDEVYFLSLSARNKYLSEADRLVYALGRTEMFSREVAYDKPGIKYALKKMAASLLYKRTRGGYEIPKQALVCYINVNPSSMIAAYHDFTERMSKLYYETMQAHIRDQSPEYTAFKRMPRMLMNSIQRNTARRVLVDVDVDTKDLEVLGGLRRWLGSHGIAFGTVWTQGGYHLLLRKDSLPKKLNLGQHLSALAVETGKEIVINKNGMVPLPGTRQADVLVEFDA